MVFWGSLKLDTRLDEIRMGSISSASIGLDSIGFYSTGFDRIGSLNSSIGVYTLGSTDCGFDRTLTTLGVYKGSTLCGSTLAPIWDPTNHSLDDVSTGPHLTPSDCGSDGL